MQDFVLDQLQKHGVHGTAIVVVVLLIAFGKYIWEEIKSIREVRRKDVEHLLKLLAELRTTLGPEVYTAMIDAIEASAFRSATGVVTQSKHDREVLNRVVRNNAGITWNLLRLTRDHWSIRGENVAVEIDIFSRIFFVIASVVSGGATLVGLAAVIFVPISLLFRIKLQEGYFLMAMGLIYMLAATGVTYLTVLPVLCARQLRSALSKLTTTA